MDQCRDLARNSDEVRQHIKAHAQHTDEQDVIEAAATECVVDVRDRFQVDEMLTHITALPRDDRWSALARAALRHDVYAALKAMTSAVLRETPAELPAQERIAQWEKLHAARVERATQTLRDALSREHVDLATLSVALRVMRSMPG